LLQLDHPDVTLGLVVREADAQFGGAPQYVLAVRSEPGQ